MLNFGGLFRAVWKETSLDSGERMGSNRERDVRTANGCKALYRVAR